MKTAIITSLTAIALAGAAAAQLNLPGDGSDGVFAPSESIVIDLAEAVDGNWDDNNAANAGKGIYDKNQWAVVFKYQSVTIPEGVTVSFANHATHAPVVWLVSEDVTIAGGESPGLIDLSGGGGSGLSPLSEVPAEPGPGGFRGGVIDPLLRKGAGLGIGGSTGNGIPGHASSYGNPRVLPLMGGSGGGANTGVRGIGSGGAGGGAILIACRRNLQLDGVIRAQGGGSVGDGRAGTGGAVKLIADQITGIGTIDVRSDGRVRLESNSLSGDLVTFPSTNRVPPGDTPVIWPPSNAPQVTVLSVGAASVPEDPSAPLSTSADVQMQTTDPVEIIIETKNFAIEGLVQLRVSPKWSGHGWQTAQYVSGDHARALWSVTRTISAGFTTFQARTIAP